MHDRSIRITPEGNNEINTKPPKNVPSMLPAEFKADNLPTTPPDFSTFFIARRATNGETIPNKTLGPAKMRTEPATDAR